MGYRTGIGAKLASMLTGMSASNSHIFCNICGYERHVYSGKNSFRPAAWFLNGKQAPGWIGGRYEKDFATFRVDICPTCRITWIITKAGMIVRREE